MRKTRTRIMTAVLVVALLLTAVPTPVQAANKADMKTANVSWDLKSDQKITFQTYYAGIGYKDCTVKVKNLKVTDAKKKGYKKLTCSVVISKPDLTAKEAHKINLALNDKAYDSVGDYVYFTLVDYQTGKSLEGKNDKNVTVTYTGVENEDFKLVAHMGCPTFQNRDCAVDYYKTWRIKKVTVTYPASYKNLCLVAGGVTKKYLDNPDLVDEFWKGTGKFSQTYLYDKNNKKVAHAMRIK